MGEFCRGGLCVLGGVGGFGVEGKVLEVGDSSTGRIVLAPGVCGVCGETGLLSSSSLGDCWVQLGSGVVDTSVWGDEILVSGALEIGDSFALARLHIGSVFRGSRIWLEVSWIGPGRDAPPRVPALGEASCLRARRGRTQNM